MATLNQRLKKVRKILKECEKEIREIADEYEDMAEETHNATKAEAYNAKAYYLFGSTIEDIQNAQTHL